MKFKDWLDLQETGTTTADVAHFSRMCIPLVRRAFPKHWGNYDTGKKKKKQPQVEEAVRRSLYDKEES